MENIWILIGPPGSGKGTQAAMLKERLGFAHVSTGAVFRREIQEKTDLGVLADKLISAGNLVPDDVTCKILQEELIRLKDSKGIILDGFPRTLAQARALDAMVLKGLRGAILIDVPKQTLIERLSARRVCPICGDTFNESAAACPKDGSTLEFRSDDKPDAIGNRFEIYKNTTMPLVAYYGDQKKLFKINGLGDPEAIYGRVLELVL